MRINIASYGGRNWLLDLARELDEHGHEVRFYSYLPNKRAQKFGLNPKNNISYFFLAIPFLGLLKITNRANWALYIFHYFFDIYVAYFSKPCDVFIGQSPMHVTALKKIKSKFGAKIILERGTRHVIEQTKALKLNPAFKNKNPMPKIFLKRDLLGYELADYITVPSNVVKESFLLNSIDEKKIFINPFGVNLKEFRATKLDSNDNYDLIIVGQWSHRKGADLLTQVCKQYKFRLLHVGSIIDVVFPYDEELFTHIDPVDQQQLVNYYSKAKVFVLPSREEGLALVQPQALICGLPIVCSEYTGGRDLRQFIENPKWIIEMKELSVEELANCIYQGLELSKSQKGIRSYSTGLGDVMSWKAYGSRYNDFLMSLK
ncbi:glycosyltransferase family 4 protein [Polaribacter sp. M15]